MSDDQQRIDALERQNKILSWVALGLHNFAAEILSTLSEDGEIDLVALAEIKKRCVTNLKGTDAVAAKIYR